MTGVLLASEALAQPPAERGEQLPSVRSLPNAERTTKLENAPRPKTKQEKLESALVAAVQERLERGIQAALSEAREQQIDVVGTRLRVIVETRGDEKGARAAVEAAGGRVERDHATLLQALMPVAGLSRLAGSDDVAYVRSPAESVPAAVAGEGAGAMGAPPWHTASLTGSGVKVGIIDSGFAGLAARQAAGDLPASVTKVDKCSGGFDTRSSHGTATAEIVHETAPDAQLYLICFDSEVAFAEAAEYAADQGIRIVNNSNGWLNVGRGDGTGTPGRPDETVARARANGILWVNSAGNHAEQHWGGPFSDPDGNDLHAFSGTDEGNGFLIAPGGTGCASLKWDDWPASDQDFDLYLAHNGSIVGGSEGLQDGTQEPTEKVCATNNTTQVVLLEMVINRYSATETPRFDLFTTGDVGPDIEYPVPAGSLLDPANSPHALAAAAICWQNNALEPYSSRGPTIDGRTKPDIAGQDSVSSGTYGVFSTCGESGYTGTSAAAPHVAGAAAIAKQTYPSATPAQLQSYLEGRALDLGPTGKDNGFGFGKLDLGRVPQCADGVDNDRDGRVDYPGDSDCSSRGDDIEFDQLRPRVATVVPAAGAPRVAPGTNVFATFSEAMRASTITRSTVKLVRRGTTRPVPATVTYDAARRRAKLDPSRALVRGTRYTATVTTGARDLAGNPLNSNKSWSFTVAR